MIAGFTCAPHRRSINLGHMTVVLALDTGQVSTLLGPAHNTWLALAPTGQFTAMSALGLPTDQAAQLVCQFREDDLVVPRPWVVPTVDPLRPSWGTNEVRAAVEPHRDPRTGAASAVGLVMLPALRQRPG